MGTPTREVYWSIAGVWIMYALLVPTALVFFWGLWVRARLWRRGRKVERTDRRRERLRGLLRDAVAQRQLLRDRASGLMHLLIFWGMAALFIGTLVVMVHQDFTIPIMQGAFYLWFQSLALDVLGLGAIAGIGLGLARRYLLRAGRLTRGTLSDWLPVTWLLVILITGFMLEGLRIRATADPWAAWSPVGKVTGDVLAALGLGTAGAQRDAYRFLWWVHLVIVFGWLACLPYTKMRHLFTSPLSIFFRNLKPRGRLEPIGLETATTLGVNTLDQFHWKDLLDLDACTECGRCTQVCPAHAVGKPLDPRAVILDLQRHMHRAGPAPGFALTRPGRGGNGARSDGGGAAATAVADPFSIPIVGNAIDPETLWSCTTCMACVEACPVEIEHVSKIVDLRRFLAMERSEAPDTAQQALAGIEDRGHPFRGSSCTRRDWYRDLPWVRELSAAGQAEFLYWVGCATALNERNHGIARALARILHAAGVDFAVLGEAESCTGDPARRMGHEYVFQMQARQNVETLAARGVTKIVTTCPHCMNTFKEEYPDLGGRFEVWHHTQLIARLIDEGRIRLKPGAAVITFHDPCYLGRAHEEYRAPRAAMDATGARRIEMDRAGPRSFCCGAGGGRYWMEDRPGQRINVERAREAAQTGADTVGTACPFCMLMLEDGIAHLPAAARPRPRDIAELVAECLDETPR